MGGCICQVILQLVAHQSRLRFH